MTYTLTATITNEANLKTIVEWLTANGIQCAVTQGIGSMPTLQPENVSTPTPTQAHKSASSTKSDFVRHDKSKAEESVGFCHRFGKGITCYEGSEKSDFTPKAISTAIKLALKDAGAKWDKEECLWTFDTIKAAKEFMKAQKAREGKKA